MIYIYVLLLENRKYYIGKTSNPKFRIENHFDNNGAEWTKIYKPIKILEIVPNCDNYDEDKYTLKYMDKYGINNVRGGSYTQIILPDEQKKLIQREIWSMKNLCNNCGSSDHWVRNCNIINSIEEKKPIIQINTIPIIEFFSKVNTNISNLYSKSKDIFNSVTSKITVK